jgi:hypothetical protein
MPPPRFNSAAAVASYAAWPGMGRRNEGVRQMRVFAKRVAAAAAGVIAFGGMAVAADFEVPPAPPQQYYGEQQYQEYYEEPLVQPGYVVPPPAPIYPYAAPVYRYGYVPPVAVVPSPYYRPYRYGYRNGPYGGRGYGAYPGRGYGAYAGRGYGGYAGRGHGAYAGRGFGSPGGHYRGHR